MSEIRDVFGFIDLLTGYQPAMVVFAARRLGVLDALGDVPQTTDELADRLEVDRAALGSLLLALDALGLVASLPDGYVQTEFADQHLAGGRDLSLVIEKEEFFARAWLSLDEVVRTGAPALQPWRSRLESDPATAHMFLEALNVLAGHTGPRLWELPELAPGQRVLDVGGGFGYYARRLAESGSSVVLADLPEVVNAVGARFSDSPAVNLVPVDVMSAPSCGVSEASMDAALVSHLLHDLAVDEGVDLLRRVLTAIRPGGSLVVNDFAGDSGPGAFGPLFDVMMKVETGGAAHPLSTLEEMIRTAGFEEVTVIDLPEPLTVLKGMRP